MALDTLRRQHEGGPPGKALARKAIAADIRSLCRAYTEENIRHLAAIMRQRDHAPARSCASERTHPPRACRPPTSCLIAVGASRRKRTRAQRSHYSVGPAGACYFWRLSRALDPMYGPAVRSKRIRRDGGKRSCINVSGLLIGALCSGLIMDISAPAFSLPDRPQWTIWVTRFRMRREDRTSISFSSSRRPWRVNELLAECYTA